MKQQPQWVGRILARDSTGIKTAPRVRKIQGKYSPRPCVWVWSLLRPTKMEHDAGLQQQQVHKHGIVSTLGLLHHRTTAHVQGIFPPSARSPFQAQGLQHPIFLPNTRTMAVKSKATRLSRGTGLAHVHVARQAAAAKHPVHVGVHTNKYSQAVQPLLSMTVSENKQKKRHRPRPCKAQAWPSQNTEGRPAHSVMRV